MSKIVVGHIGPIYADKLRISSLQELEPEEKVTVQVPLKLPGIFTPTLVSSEPLVVTQETLEHAARVAQQILDLMPQMPPTALAGDLITMAYAVLHYRSQSK